MKNNTGTARPFDSFVVAGGGAWGTALACAAAQAGRSVTLWVRSPSKAQEIQETRENKDHLPGVSLPDAVQVTSDKTVLGQGDALLLVVPAQYLRGFLQELPPELMPENRPLILCAKGIERAHYLLPTQIVAALFPKPPLAVLSGPNFAHEVAKGLPAATVLACEDEGLAHRLALALKTTSFRPYISTDPLGAQIGGAVKNVLAIACGIVVGRGLGENARAALITRGLAEMARLGAAMGAQSETMMGLSGMGDLVLTCSSLTSRNMSLGAALGEGQKLDAILAARNSVSEGVFSAQATVELAARFGIEMPIARAVHAILNEGAAIDATMRDLLNRPLKKEE